MLLLPLLLSCTPAVKTPAPKPPPAYVRLLRKRALDQNQLAVDWQTADEELKEALLDESRELVTDLIVQDLFPFWDGTPWAFYGDTEVPQKGRIACGYFVSTILEDAGFVVEREQLAQQAAEHIMLTFARPQSLKRFSNRPASEVVDYVHGQGDGLYLIGLDYHVGFLVRRDKKVEMCHSAPSTGVTCEDALTSPSMVSKYRVVGPVMEDHVMEKWLEQENFVTVKNSR